MSAPDGDNATTEDQTSSLCSVVLTTTSGQSVRGGLDDRTGTQATDSGDSGDGGGDGDADLSANRFGIEDRDTADDIDADAAELEADQYAEKVARLWGTPEGEWWP